MKRKIETTVNYEHIICKKPKHQTSTHKNPTHSFENLHTKGYEIYRNAFNFSDDLLKQINKQSEKCTPIFNYNEDHHEDFKRSLKKLSPKTKTISTLIEETTHLFKQITPTLNPNEWVILKSLPGCQQQTPHTDYLPREDLKSTNDQSMPLLAIISLMDGTKIDVWPNSIKLITNPTNNQTTNPTTKNKPNNKPNDTPQLIKTNSLKHKMSRSPQQRQSTHFQRRSNPRR